MSTYFIQAKDGGEIKIGKSNSQLGARGRLKQLQTGHPKELVLLGVVQDAERDLHQLFSAYRSRGEWFFPGPSLVEFIRLRFGKYLPSDTDLPQVPINSHMPEVDRRTKNQLVIDAAAATYPRELIVNPDSVLRWLEANFTCKHHNSTREVFTRLVHHDRFIGACLSEKQAPMFVLQSPSDQPLELISAIAFVLNKTDILRWQLRLLRGGRLVRVNLINIYYTWKRKSLEYKGKA